MKKLHSSLASKKIDNMFSKSLYAFIFALCLVFAPCHIALADASKHSESFMQSSVNIITETDITIQSDIEERILSVCPSAFITVPDDSSSLVIDLTDCYDSSNIIYVEKMVHDWAYIIGTSKFDEKYSGVTFFYMGENLTCSMLINEYESIADYASWLVCLDGESTHITALRILYETLFHNHTIENRQLIAQGEIAKKYGVNGGDATAEPEMEDDLWFYSSFSDSLPHKLSESTYVINYRDDMDNKYAYGQTVGKNINNAIKNLKQYINNKPELLSFDGFLIICFDGDSDSRFLEYKLTKTDSGTWSVALYNVFDDNFKKGFESTYN